MLNQIIAVNVNLLELLDVASISHPCSKVIHGGEELAEVQSSELNVHGDFE